MSQPLLVAMLPALEIPRIRVFNVFDVMRHGTHEKQLSNVFAWLLDPQGTHGLSNRLQVIFIEEVNRTIRASPVVGAGDFSVRQEVNVALADQPQDIADLVLESEDTVLVVENYYTSDGHGHSYDDYLRYGESSGKRAVVVMLCARVSGTRLTDGWENAAVVSYAELIAPLMRMVEADAEYQRRYPDQLVFLRHLHAQFVKESSMNDSDLVTFIDAMCSTGAAKHYRAQDTQAAGLAFADTLRESAVDQFHEGRAFLQRTKAELKAYVTRHLAPQLNEAFGGTLIRDVSASYAGIYQWSINVRLTSDAPGSEPSLQVKFGPSAWFANEGDSGWQSRVQDADYKHLFLTKRSTMGIRQSAVTLAEAAAGISPSDLRLRDEITDLLAESPRLGE